MITRMFMVNILIKDIQDLILIRKILFIIKLYTHQELGMLLWNMEVFSIYLPVQIRIVELMICINLILKPNNGIKYFRQQEIVT